MKKGKVLVSIALGFVFLATFVGMQTKSAAQGGYNLLTMEGDINEVRLLKSGVMTESLWIKWSEGGQKIDVEWSGDIAVFRVPEGMDRIMFVPPEGWSFTTDFEAVLPPFWYRLPEPNRTKIISMRGDRNGIVFTRTAEFPWSLEVIWGNDEFEHEQLIWVDNRAELVPPEGVTSFHFSYFWPSGWSLDSDFTYLGERWWEIPEPKRFQVFLPLVATPPKVIRMSGNRDEIRFEKSSSAEAPAHVLWGVSSTPREDLVWDGNVATLEAPEGATTLWFTPPEGWQLDTSFSEAGGPNWWNIPPAR